MFDFLKRTELLPATPKSLASDIFKPPPPKAKSAISKRNYNLTREKNSDKEFLSIFRQLTLVRSPWEVWRDFVTMYACAISNAFNKLHYDEREKLYMNIIVKYKKFERMLFPQLIAETVMALELNPEQDFLGKIFMQLELQNPAKAQFFTPHNVCNLMARLGLDDIVLGVKENGYVTINDPCCGAGATLIAAINESKKQLMKEKLNFQNHILVVGQDIDATVALMCYIQISLLGVAGYIKIGNSLTEPMETGDSPRNYWFTPMYFSNVWSTRRFMEDVSSLFKGDV